MRPLSQVDPFGGCPLCRRQYERGELPMYSWLHEAKTRFLRLVGGVVPSWTRGTEPVQKGPVAPAAGPYWSSLGAGVASVLGKLPVVEKGGSRCQATK